MNITVNGKELTLEKALTVAELLETQKVEMAEYVTVQINDEFVDREDFVRLIIKENDVPTCKQAGVLGVMGGIIGSIQATEAIKYLLGIGDLLTGSLLTYDALKMEFRKVKLSENKKCPVCGENPTITELIDYEQAACDLKK